MIDLNWNPDKRQLRQFAVAFLVFSAVAGGVLWRRLGPGWASYALWIAGPVVAAVGLLLPRAMKPLFIGLSLLAFPIGFVVGFVLLALTYYTIVTGIGLLFKLFGRDSMDRKLEPGAESYWKKRPPAPPPGHYFRQF